MQKIPFEDLQVSPQAHFKLCFYGAILHLIGELARSLESFEDVFKRFPFLAAYSDQIAARGAAGLSLDAAADWWRQSMEEWENTSDEHLPIRAIRKAGHLDYSLMTIFMYVGMAEEDSRFGEVFEAFQSLPGQRRPTYGLLSSWDHQLRDEGTRIQQLINLGLLRVSNSGDPRSEWTLQVPDPLWDVLRDNRQPIRTSWLKYVPLGELTDFQQLVLPSGTREQLTEVSRALSANKIRSVVIRGPQRNGRRTILGAIARSLARGILVVDCLAKTDDKRWLVLGPLATALNAMPLVGCDLAPGETIDIPSLRTYEGPTAVVLGSQGGVAGDWAEGAITLSLDVPEPEERKAHWVAGAGGREILELESIADRYRMTRGNVHRAAATASSYTAVKNEDAIQPLDVQRAVGALSHEVLDNLAERVDTSGDWSNLATASHTFEDLRSLERRCRHRERLRSAVGPVLGLHLNSGVRALFSGPSGTGKTLAARLLAGSLRMDLYRINLALVVNKYIGETEKNLNLVLSRAEELPVMLLLDEGDALLTQRTNVQSSNDRYANLETNFLLQRLESFDGIILITTNAGDRIDGAFLRRMDMVIDFRPPDAAERWNLWTMFLPARHSVDLGVLSDIASRCSMTGGQIRNAMLHASLLALSNGGIITSDYLESAVRREFRKAGVACPLRRVSEPS